MIRWTHGLVNRLVAAADILCLAGGTLAAAAVTGLPFTGGQAALLCGLGIFIFTQVLTIADAYRRERYSLMAGQILDLACGLAAAAFCVAVVARVFVPSALASPAAPMGWGVGWGAICLAMVIAGRLLGVRGLLRHVAARKLLRRNAVVIGTGDGARACIRLLAGRQEEYRLLGLFDERTGNRLPADVDAVPVLGGLEDLFAFAADHEIHLVVVAMPWEAALRIFRLIEKIEKLSADVVIPLEEDRFFFRFARIADLAGRPALQVMFQPLKGSQGILKVLEDRAVAAVGLILALPILLLAALAIRLDSPGPAVFLQNRIGFNGKTFKIWKLRTMQFDPCDDGCRGTLPSDPRITAVGRILRRFSLDELPQLINVLRGEMSIVGPRPYVPNMVVGGEECYEQVRQYAARYRVKPGITGWAQIHGMRGIDSVEMARRGVEMDIFYIENWSLGFDIRIMIQTLATGMLGKGVF